MIILEHLRNLLTSKRRQKISDFGLILDWKFHKRKRWVSASMPFLVDEILAEFAPVVISSQRQYNYCKRHLKFIVAFEPGWAAPLLNYDRRINCCKAVIYSDPHYKSEERRKYFELSGFDYLLSLYNSPFHNHFRGFPSEKFIYFPWAIPDQFISSHTLTVRSSEVAIFGGRNSDAYDVRNWCREQAGITSYEFSGVENKKMTDVEYFSWLNRFDAIVAAGSTNSMYDLVTPKYFEIAAAGVLLIGQYCDDLNLLGFNESNCVIFRKENFNEKIASYQHNPAAYIEHRRRGRSLIASRHKISDRIAILRKLYDAV